MRGVKDFFCEISSIEIGVANQLLYDCKDTTIYSESCLAIGAGHDLMDNHPLAIASRYLLLCVPRFLLLVCLLNPKVLLLEGDAEPFAQLGRFVSYTTRNDEGNLC